MYLILVPLLYIFPTMARQVFWNIINKQRSRSVSPPVDRKHPKSPKRSQLLVKPRPLTPPVRVLGGARTCILCGHSFSCQCSVGSGTNTLDLWTLQAPALSRQYKHGYCSCKKKVWLFHIVLYRRRIFWAPFTILIFIILSCVF